MIVNNKPFPQHPDAFVEWLDFQITQSDFNLQLYKKASMLVAADKEDVKLNIYRYVKNNYLKKFSS